jgi:hypothetical protein
MTGAVGRPLPDRGADRAHVATPRPAGTTDPTSARERDTCERRATWAGRAAGRCRQPAPAGSRPAYTPCPRRDARGCPRTGTSTRRIAAGLHRPVPTSRRRAVRRAAWHRRPSPAGSRPSRRRHHHRPRARVATARRFPEVITCRIAATHVAPVPTLRRRGQLAPTTRTLPVAATRAKLGDVGGNVGLTSGRRRAITCRIAAKRRPPRRRSSRNIAPCPRRDAGGVAWAAWHRRPSPAGSRPGAANRGPVPASRRVATPG